MSEWQDDSRMHWDTAPYQYSSLASIEDASPMLLGSLLDRGLFIHILNSLLSLPHCLTSSVSPQQVAANVGVPVVY